MNQARVAVVTRTKNRTILLKRAIGSVLQQTCKDWHHVIVNDGGDASAVRALVAGFLPAYEGRLTVVDNPVSVGMEAASNIGIRASDSQYVVIHDDDDSWEPSFMERCLAFMDDATQPRLKREYGGVITYSLRILEEMEGEQVRRTASEPFNTWMPDVSLYRLAAGNTFPPISFLFKRQALEEIGYFREDLPVLGDWDFHLRFCHRYEIGLIPELLANYHHRLALTSGVYGNTVIAADAKHRTYENLYRNELLREDLEQGRLGLGFLVHSARSFERIHGQIWPMESVVLKLAGNRWLRRLARLFPRGGGPGRAK